MSDEAKRNKIIDHVLDLLAGQFRFGYYDIDDMRQQGWVFALEALNTGQYDENRPLEKLLYVHIRNRFINLKRNKFHRNEPPCTKCPFFRPDLPSQCGAFQARTDCDKYKSWQKRNSAKQSLMNNAESYDRETYSQGSLDTEISSREIFDKIDHELPSNLRSDYLRILDGAQIPDVRRQRVREAIKNILGDYLNGNEE
jgi:DNA-directed RNA polymerase specialized sigma24 family protein